MTAHSELPLEFYKVIVEHMTEGLWVGDKDHHTKYVNPAFERIFGYTRKYWQGTHSFDYFDEKNKAIIKEANRLRKKGEASQYEVEVLAKSGELIPVFMSGAPTPDEGTVGIMMDLRLLKETEERYRKLVEAMNEGLWVGDKQNKTLYANPAFLTILGYKLHEILGKELSSFLAPDSVFKLSKSGRPSQENFSHQESNLLSKTGETIPAILHLSPFIKGYLITLTDLRSIKHLERRANEFQAIAQFSVDAMISLDAQNTIRAWNVGAERMFGWSANDMMDKPLARLMPTEKINSGELNYLLQEAKKRGSLRNHETVCLHKNGNPIQVSLTYTALKDTKGHSLGYSAVYRDITMQKQWERDLQRRFDKMQEAYVEMGKLRRYLDYLGELVDLGVAEHRDTNIGQFIVHAILMFAKADAVILRLYDETKNQLTLTATAGSTQDWENKATLPFAGSLAEQAFLATKPLKFLDITQEPLYRSAGLARKNNLRSLLLIPLKVEHEKIGTLSVYITTDKSLDVLDHEFIPLFAKQASLVLSASPNIL